MTATGLNLSRYILECSCGYEMTVHGKDVESEGLLTWRVDCVRCGTVNYGKARSKAARVHERTLELQFAIHDVFAEIAPPMTVRQVFYRLSALHKVAKDDAGYNRVQRELTKMRRAGTIPYHWISDESRSYYGTTAHRDLGEALEDMRGWYRRDLWAEQNAHVEIWLEKRALAGVLRPITSEFGVRLYPMGGYGSISYAYEAAMELCAIDKPIYIYHLSDFDADGVYSSTVLENELREHGATFSFMRLGLTRADIDYHNLHAALRPQKRTSARWNWWKEQFGAQQLACELDALHPDALRQMVRDAITQHIDPWSWDRLKLVEQKEKESLSVLVDSLKHTGEIAQ